MNGDKFRLQRYQMDAYCIWSSENQFLFRDLNPISIATNWIKKVMQSSTASYSCFLIIIIIIVIIIVIIVIITIIILITDLHPTLQAVFWESSKRESSPWVAITSKIIIIIINNKEAIGIVVSPYLNCWEICFALFPSKAQKLSP